MNLRYEKKIKYPNRTMATEYNSFIIFQEETIKKEIYFSIELPVKMNRIIWGNPQLLSWGKQRPKEIPFVYEVNDLISLF